MRRDFARLTLVILVIERSRTTASWASVGGVEPRNALEVGRERLGPRVDRGHLRRMVLARRAPFRRDLAQAEKAMAEGRDRPARQQLAELTNRRPRSTEAAYQLGLCEDVLGHKAAAMKIWSGIAPGSPFFIQAALGRVLLLMNAGKFSQAEDLLVSLPCDRGAYAGHVRSQLELLLRIEGRDKERRSLIVESWPGGAGPSDVLKRLFMLEDAPFPLDYVREALARGDQNDDRFWLGRANLATWCGRYEEANRWLDPCEWRRPEDQAVWHCAAGVGDGERRLRRRPTSSRASERRLAARQ